MKNTGPDDDILSQFSASLGPAQHQPPEPPVKNETTFEAPEPK